MANLVRDTALAARIAGTAVAAGAVRFAGGTGTRRHLQFVDRFESLTTEWDRTHPYVPGPETGCCGCGAPVADLLIELAPADPHHECSPWGETYCWVCYDSGRVGLAPTDTMSVFPGHGARRAQVSA